LRSEILRNVCCLGWPRSITISEYTIVSHLVSFFRFKLILWPMTWLHLSLYASHILKMSHL
jgi:hypothetical protein